MTEGHLQPTDVPTELYETDQWLCWREEDRNGKPTKIPIAPENGYYASATDPETWSTFDEATDRLTEADGLGFVFTHADPVVGVDLDDCRDPDSGAPADWAKDVIESLDSYTEVSPSGTGYHVLVKGELPGDRNRRGDLECYETARFFTVTGNHVAGTPTTINDRTSELDEVYDSYLCDTVEETDEATPDTTETTSQVDDEELLEKAKDAANGSAFAQLYRGSTGGYESHSEADMALCSHLAFWTGGDATQMDRLFRDSGLMREKWNDQHYADGSTYGEKTIERAIAGTQEFYDPGGESSEETDGEGTAMGTANQTTASDQPPVAPSNDSAIDSGQDELAGETPSLRAREIKRMERIDELEQTLRAVIAEKERLQDELDEERAKRRKAGSEDKVSAESTSSLLPWR